LPALSLALHVTVVVAPLENCVPEAGEHDAVTGSVPPVVAGAAYATAIVAAVVDVLMAAGQATASGMVVVVDPPPVTTGVVVELSQAVRLSTHARMMAMREVIYP